MARKLRFLVKEAASAGGRIDAEAGVIYNAKLFGWQSKNRRKYRPDVVQKRLHLYESSSVFADHDFSGAVRPMRELGGTFLNVRVEKDGVYGDFHALKSTEAGRVIMEAAAKMPRRFGFSPYHVLDVIKGRDGLEEVVDIIEVKSVDAVTRPATTNGVWESQIMAEATNGTAAPEPAPVGMSVEDAFAQLEVAITASLEGQERIDALKTCEKFKSKLLGGGGSDTGSSDGTEADTPAPESVQLTTEQKLVRAERRLLCLESNVAVDEKLLDVLAALDDARAKDHVAYLARTRKNVSAPRSGGRVAAGESTTRPTVPMLSKGAKVEDVKRYLSGR